MEILELKSDNSGVPVQQQLEKLGYIILKKGIPKFLAQKSGQVFWVFITPLFRGQKLTPEQKVIANMLDDDEVRPLMVKMPK